MKKNEYHIPVWQVKEVRKRLSAIRSGDDKIVSSKEAMRFIRSLIVKKN